MLTLVTGASGQVGRPLVNALRARGRRVRAMVLPNDRALGSLEGDGVEVVEGDVRDARSLEAALADVDVVYHLAAIVSTEQGAARQLWGVNAEGARNAARAAREARVRRFVYFSSIVVFDPQPHGRPLDETRPRLSERGEGPYVRSKIRGESAVRDEVIRGLDAVIVHPTVIVGPHETHHDGIVRGLIGPVLSGKLLATVAGGFNLVAVDDVVAGAIAAEERGRRGESYILGGRWYPVSDLAARVASLAGRRGPRIELPMWMARTALPFATLGARAIGMRPIFNATELDQLEGNRQICIDKAEHELGYRPRPIDASLEQIRDWLQSQGA